MSITHSYSEITPGQKSISVRFLNEEGLEHKKELNVPYNSDGSVNESYWNQIIEDQIRGIEHKLSLGVIEFGEPEPESTYVPPE
jgi:hypothetical protein